MGRRILAIILILLALGLVVMAALLAFTPLGGTLFAQDAPTATAVPTLPPPTPTPQPTPILTVVGEPPTIHVKAAYLLDADTGHTLDDFQGEVPLPMASTTKIMTAVIALQTGDLNQVITVRQDAINEVNNNNGSSAQLKVGDKLTLHELLYALLLPSGDDAAIAIADGLSGSQDNFVNVMNIFAYRLHLFQTHYINADGLTYYSSSNLPIPGHYTTAYDLIRLAQYAMNIPLFAQIVKTPQYALPASGTHHSYTWTTTNALLSRINVGDAPTVQPYPGTTGIKTGYTLEAGGCLVFSATRNNHHLMGVVLGSANYTQRFIDAVTLLNWGFGLPVRIPAHA